MQLMNEHVHGCQRVGAEVNVTATTHANVAHSRRVGLANALCLRICEFTRMRRIRGGLVCAVAESRTGV